MLAEIDVELSSKHLEIWYQKFRKWGEVRDLVASYVKVIVEGIKEVNEITNGETCRRGWRRPVIEIWGNAHLAVEGEQSMKTEQSVR